MVNQAWNRRRILQIGALGASAGLVRLATAQQLPPPVPLNDKRITLTTTTSASPWQSGSIFQPTFRWDMLNLNVSKEDLTQAARSTRTMQGFGACFNELGWIALQKLSPADRDTVLQELFDVSRGARFSYCRMPISANDFSTEAYSYDEIDGDFELKHFSIEHDRATLIPFIHAAQSHNPSLRLWASPWPPPSWMKRNGFYAEAEARGGGSQTAFGQTKSVTKGRASSSWSRDTWMPMRTTSQSSSRLTVNRASM